MSSVDDRRPAPGADRSRDRPALEARGPDQAFPGVSRARRCRSRHRAGRDRRAARPERRRQVDADPDLRRRCIPPAAMPARSSFAGEPFRADDVAEAEAAGVALVPQEVNVVPDLTVAENIFLNAEPTRCGLIDIGRAAGAAPGQRLRDFGLDLDPDAPMASLDLATQQLVVIARALSKNARLLILDEPTAALTEREVAAAVRADARAESARRRHHLRLAPAGRGLRHLRPHRRHARRPHPRRHRDGARRRATTIVAEMVGDAGVAQRDAQPRRRSARVALEVARARRSSTREGRHARRRVSISTVRKGEIVGLFGLLGAGCIEAALAHLRRLAGPARGRRSLVDGAEVDDRQSRPTRSRSASGLMAQDRRDCLISDHSIADNIGIASLGKRRRATASSTSAACAAAGARPGRRARASRRRRSTPRCGRCRAATSRRCRSRAGSPPTPASSC